MVVAIFPSLEGESLEDFSIKLAQAWRVGQKGLDTGLILLVFVRDRKVRFEVGYGLEPVVTDALAAQIIREAIGPRFREGRYAAGIDGAITAVFERVEARAAPGAPGGRRGGGGAFPVTGLLGFFVILAVIAVVLLQEAWSARRFARGNAYSAGRGGGWTAPVIIPPIFWGGGGGRRGDDSFGGGIFSGGGGTFGGGGASGDW